MALTSTDFDNAEIDLQTTSIVANSKTLAGAATDTTITRLGDTADTLNGRLKKLGYIPPIAYAGSIVFTALDNVKTVDESGSRYAPKVGELPFTTSGTWVGDDEDKFYLIEGARVAQLSAEFADISNLVGATSLNAGTVDWSDYEGRKVTTVHNNNTSKAGGADYVIWALADYRAEIGDPAWVPDGYVHHYLFGGSYVAILDSGGVFNLLQCGVIFDGNIQLQTGTDNTLAVQAVFDNSTLYSTIEIHSNTGMPAFIDQCVYQGNRTYDFGSDRGGGLALKPNASSSSFGVLVPDRWYENDQSLGRPVTFKYPNIYGNRNGTGNSGLSIHGLVICNFRGEIFKPYITECGGDGIHGPSAMRSSSFTGSFKCVGIHILHPRIWEVNGSCINMNSTAYSDGWLTDCSFAQADANAVRLVKGSGWYIAKVHTDTIRGSLLVVSTVSTMDIDGWYLETYNNDADGQAAFSIGGILSDGITIKNITGNVDAGRTGYFFDFFTSNNTTPSIVIDNVQIDFDASLNGNLKFCRVTTGSLSPTDLHVINVSKSPSQVFEYSGTNNVDLHDINNVWNRFLGNANDYQFIIGDQALVHNDDKASNLNSIVLAPSGTIAKANYTNQSKTNSTADYSVTFPVIVNTQIAGSCLISIISRDFFNQADRGTWVGRVIWSQDILNETPSLSVVTLSAATLTLSAPTITLNNIGTINNNDYELSITGTNSSANARTSVIFSN